MDCFLKLDDLEVSGGGGGGGHAGLPLWFVLWIGLHGVCSRRLCGGSRDAEP